MRKAADLTRIWGPGSFPANYPVAWCERIGETGEQHNANARFIVRACNAHDDLLEACRMLWKEAKYDDQNPSLMEAFEKARVAIAKAKQPPSNPKARQNHPNARLWVNSDTNGRTIR